VTPLPAARVARRLLVAVLCLAVIDPLVPRLLGHAERARYESTRLFRFENSDLFPLGPLVEYLRENPRGVRPRVVFLGNSIVWGYFLAPSESVPAQFQQLAPEAKVFNLGINGFESGSAYLVTKAIVDRVDTLYLFDVGRTANAMLPHLVPVSHEDARRFALEEPSRLERGLQRLLGFWSLYRDSYRLQAALFGTSTRVYLYLNKGSLLTPWRDRAPAPPSPEPIATTSPTGLEVDAPQAGTPPAGGRLAELAARHPLLWDYARLVASHGKRAVIVELADYSPAIDATDRADLNAHFHPAVVFLRLRVSKRLQMDGVHFSAAGAAAVARVLRQRAPVPTPPG
jgi:hypothetical protein